MSGNDSPAVQEARSFSVNVTENYPGGGSPAAELLAAVSGLSKAMVKQAMSKGAVWRESAQAGGALGKARRLRRATAALAAGDRLSLYFNPRVLAASCAEPVLIADRRRFSVWDKPPGMLCQGSKWGDHLTLNRWAEAHMPGRPAAFVVHRLDRMASGLVVLAHDKRAAASLSRQFAERSVTKRYHCIVAGFPTGPLPLMLEQPLDGKPAWTCIEQARPAQQWLDSAARGSVSDQPVPPPGYALLTVRIGTGRKHQIRQHLSQYGLPLVGDRLYDSGTSHSFGNNFPAGTADSRSAVGTKMVPAEAIPDLQLRSVYLAFDDPENGLRSEWNIPK